MKKWLVVALALTIPLVLSGCLVISSLSASQPNTVGNVRIVLQACFSETSGTCVNPGNSESAASDSVQAMVAFRIPAAVEAPASFSTTAGVPLTFDLSPSYATALQTLSAAPAGQQWVGYLATTTVAVVNGADQAFTVQPEFQLTPASDGSPFVGPFLYRPVVGARIISPPTYTLTQDVNCDTSSGSPGMDTACVDSPTATDAATNLSLSTRDLGVVAGATTVNATHGSTATVPFTLKYAGTATATANFAITASTTLPGATAMPSQGSLLPASDSSNPVNVGVTIPADASPGTYNVMLTATLSNGQVRTGTGKLTVKDTTKPTVTITFAKKQTIRTLLAHGLKLKAKMSEAGSVVFALYVKVGTTVLVLSFKTVGYGSGATKQITLPMNKSVLKSYSGTRLHLLSKVSLTLHATAKDTAGNKLVVSKKIKLSR